MTTPPQPLEGSIVVVAKCPIPGKSKTRLIPLLGPDGSAQLAKAMLCDVLTALSNDEYLSGVQRILLFAPPNLDGKELMERILDECRLEHCYGAPSSPDAWMLMPMLDGDLEVSDLGAKLTDALIRTREIQKHPAPVIFLGMDSPELPLDEIAAALREPDSALLCPANDGGYGMLSVPSHLDAQGVFQAIRWSDPLTALSQLKALTDIGASVVIGRLMNDMDEPDDVRELAERLYQGDKEHDHDDCLTLSSSGEARIADCPQTRAALDYLGSHLFG